MSQYEGILPVVYVRYVYNPPVRSSLGAQPAREIGFGNKSMLMRTFLQVWLLELFSSLPYEIDSDLKCTGMRMRMRMGSLKMSWKILSWPLSLEILPWAQPWQKFFSILVCDVPVLFSPSSTLSLFINEVIRSYESSHPQKYTVQALMWDSQYSMVHTLLEEVNFFIIKHHPLIAFHGISTNTNSISRLCPVRSHLKKCYALWSF